ncbi:SDR family NAD(P)-dependent oxidoreductase [Bordetella sp. 02P26C-1]|uniref:SDR family NAD(P)-dependent oxidoreductase n=1 Tax=Bordetella sp. 02P26C-1 TaxID=2683195 RepID=UPI001F417777|nr:SDR family oxidoreductase [Bordetella sp. 02P26C-1]
MSTMHRFEGKSVIVTGAARGIGAATAKRFADEGAKVLLVDLLPEVLETAKSVGGQGLVLDVALPGAGDTIVEAALAHAGRIDVLVNNAGVGGSKHLLKSDDESLSRIIDINLISLLRITRAVLPHLPQPGGSIVNLSSIFGMVGYPGTTAYAVAKAGVTQFTQQLTSEVAHLGIRVNAIAPGVVVTPMTAGHLQNPSYVKLMVDSTPMGRVCQPEEQAAVIAFLASEDASFVCGVTLPVDGGYLAARYTPNY